jgi:hypothetical protein
MREQNSSEPQRIGGSVIHDLLTRQRPKHRRLLEKHVAQAIMDYHKWCDDIVLPLRAEWGTSRPPARDRVVPPGTADLLVIKRWGGEWINIFVETKRPGEVPDPHQVEWAETMDEVGHIVVWADDADRYIKWVSEFFR